MPNFDEDELQLVSSSALRSASDTQNTAGESGKSLLGATKNKESSLKRRKTRRRLRGQVLVLRSVSLHHHRLFFIFYYIVKSQGGKIFSGLNARAERHGGSVGSAASQ